MGLKHSLAPWRAVKDAEEPDLEIIAADGCAIAIVLANKNKDEIANSKMMTSAPDLLDALANIAEREKERIESEKRKGCKLINISVYEIARHAIAKATGEAP